MRMVIGLDCTLSFVQESFGFSFHLGFESPHKILPIAPSPLHYVYMCEHYKR